MKRPSCTRCNKPMSKNGTTTKGTIRYRCTTCGKSSHTKYDPTATNIRIGLNWLMNRASLQEQAIPERTLRRKTQAMWSRTPPVPRDGVIYPVLHLDGIHLGRNAVVLIAVNEQSYVVGWYVARRETAHAWQCLLGRLAPPDLVVCDGGGGLLKALRNYWPHTPIQRCLFHVKLNIETTIGRHPRYIASKQLLRLATQLSRVTDETTARQWLIDYNAWCNRHSAFLNEKSTNLTNQERDLHQRLMRAKRTLDRRLKEEHLFTFLQFEHAPATNNRIESLNARIRAMLRDHRGLDLTHRIKAVCWWCHCHTQYPCTDAWLAKHAVTDQQLQAWYENSWRHSAQYQHDVLGMPEHYGIGIDWNEFHTYVPWQDNY